MMNLADPELELIDPTPNIHSMFLNFDKTFFWGQLSSRCVVRWSKRMYSCAGITSYEGRGGLCDIALSEPLLKLRPRKDFIETLLHEMIHAYLFVKNKDQNRDGHGPNFKAHMHRINRAAGLNISIYHDFHDEVKLYQTHWWRCNGPCQLQRPYFGIVRRINNRAPGPNDRWWSSHQRFCGGTFIKIQEPQKPEKKTKKNSIATPNANITKYITNNNNKEASNKNILQNDQPKKSLLKDSSNIPVKPNVGIKKNSNSTLLVTNKNVIFKPQVAKPKSAVFNGIGLTIGTDQTNNLKRIRSSSTGVLETVRNVWANKQIDTINTKKISKDSLNTSNRTKHKADGSTKSPPHKIKKIDDYFKTASTVLKDLYGQDFNITQSKSDEKLKAVPKTKSNNVVDCPVCYKKIDSGEINRHLDECLNKSAIEKLSKDSNIVKHKSKVDCHQSDKRNLKEIVGIEVLNELDKCKKEEEQNSKNKDDYNKSSSSIKEHIISANLIRVTNTGLVNDANRKRATASFDIGDFWTSDEIMIAIDEKNINITKSDSFKGPILNKVQDVPLENTEPITLNSTIQSEAGSSKSDSKSEMACPCCGDKLNTSVDEHLDNCLSFFENNTTIPEEGASNSFITETIIIDDDDDDKFDESQTFNATGTKFPCPCCLNMVEEIDMNSHLDKCLR